MDSIAKAQIDRYKKAQSKRATIRAITAKATAVRETFDGPLLTFKDTSMLLVRYAVGELQLFKG